MINVECIINASNKYKEEKWPTEMAARPLKGDCVESKNGHCTLSVINVAHVTLIVPDKESCCNGRKEVIGLKVYLSL
jgi:hypothetical protein